MVNKNRFSQAKIEDKKSLNILYPRLNIVPLQTKEFFGWLCKSQQDATFCLFFLLF